jgi:hypothetical protein
MPVIASLHRVGIRIRFDDRHRPPSSPCHYRACTLGTSACWSGSPVLAMSTLGTSSRAGGPGLLATSGRRSARSALGPRDLRGRGVARSTRHDAAGDGPSRRGSRSGPGPDPRRRWTLCLLPEVPPESLWPPVSPNRQRGRPRRSSRRSRGCGQCAGRRPEWPAEGRQRHPPDSVAPSPGLVRAADDLVPRLAPGSAPSRRRSAARLPWNPELLLPACDAACGLLRACALGRDVLHGGNSLSANA